MLRVIGLMKWALVCQARLDNKASELRDRVKRPGEVRVDSTRFERE
jgi:hypothetical protein